MNVNSHSLPKIMYDQTQFTPIYFAGLNGIWLSGDAYMLMRELSGYAPSIWYTYTQNKPTSFWFGAFDEAALQKESENGFAYFSKPETIPYFEKTIDAHLSEAIVFQQRFFTTFFGKEADAIANNPNEVADFLKQIHASISHLMGHYLLTQPQRFYGFEEKIKEHISNSDLVFVASNGHRLTLVSQVQKALLEKNFDAVDRLGFLNWSLLGGERITRESLVQNEEDERLKQSNLEEVLQRRSGLLSKNSTEIYRLADVMGRAAVLRFDLQTIALCILKYADVLLEAVRTRYGLTKDELNSYLYSELLELLISGNKVPTTELEKRQLGCLVRYAEEGVSTYYSGEAHEVIKDLLELRRKEIESAEELKGTIASWPDKSVEVITGSCFVMTTAFDADTVIRGFKADEILVATQTHPSVVPIMRLAKAIVTDEGGITCHAAIVSRELGKPCVIGTRLGTKVFKNGDTIEVNMKTGVVRRLSE